jgi:hypothetical protein
MAVLREYLVRRPPLDFAPTFCPAGVETRRVKMWGQKDRPYNPYKGLINMTTWLQGRNGWDPKFTALKTLPGR